MLVVATPVYKAAYTGLLKHLFDLIDPKVLAGPPRRSSPRPAAPTAMRW